MNAHVERFYAATDKIEEAVREMFSVLNEAGVNLAESNLARRVREIEANTAEARDHVEEVGFGEQG